MQQHDWDRCLKFTWNNWWDTDYWRSWLVISINMDRCSLSTSSEYEESQRWILSMRRGTLHANKTDWIPYRAGNPLIIFSYIICFSYSGLTQHITSKNNSLRFNRASAHSVCRIKLHNVLRRHQMLGLPNKRRRRGEGLDSSSFKIASAHFRLKKIFLSSFLQPRFVTRTSILVSPIFPQ